MSNSLPSPTPLVSVCLPNLNNRRYLPERLDTVFRQTLTNWELIAVDNHSDDGAWEFLQEAAQREPRLRVWQAPREGMYPNWNNCIRAARGEYVYIATSDDTMPPDCLAKLVRALERHPECDLAHCRLRAFDENGDVAALNRWWEVESDFAVSCAGRLHQPHVRLAPFDGLLHLGGLSIYISITQLLIRRTLFDRIGLFQGRWGSIGDFEWDMRASLVANTVHVPDTWGGWRLHAAQATQHAELHSHAHRLKREEMMDHAIEAARGLLSPEVASLLAGKERLHFRSRWELVKELEQRPSSLARLPVLMRHLVAGSRAAAFSYAAGKLRLGRDWRRPVAETVRGWLKTSGCGEPLIAAGGEGEPERVGADPDGSRLAPATPREVALNPKR